MTVAFLHEDAARFALEMLGELVHSLFGRVKQQQGFSVGDGEFLKSFSNFFTKDTKLCMEVLVLRSRQALLNPNIRFDQGVSELAWIGICHGFPFELAGCWAEMYAFTIRLCMKLLMDICDPN